MNIRRLIAEDYLDLMKQFIIYYRKQVTFDEFCDWMNKINGKIFVIEDPLKNIVVASGTIFIEHKFIHNLGKVGHIEDIIVHKDYKSRGLGGKIIGHLVDYAEMEGCYKIILDCHEEYLGFYKHLGFKQRGVHMAIYF